MSEALQLLRGASPVEAGSTKLIAEYRPTMYRCKVMASTTGRSPTAWPR
jgi:hypothetical protein